MRSPTLLLMRMNAADTNASSAIADCTPLTVVPRSCTTAEIDTFINDVSTTSTNIAIANRIASRGLPVGSAGTGVVARSVTGIHPPTAARARRGSGEVPGDRLVHKPREVRTDGVGRSDRPRRLRA